MAIRSVCGRLGGGRTLSIEDTAQKAVRPLACRGRQPCLDFGGLGPPSLLPLFCRIAAPLPLIPRRGGQCTRNAAKIKYHAVFALPICTAAAVHLRRARPGRRLPRHSMNNGGGRISNFRTRTMTTTGCGGGRLQNKVYIARTKLPFPNFSPNY